MCVAILQQKGKQLTMPQLYAGWEINSHGGGFAYIDDDGKVGIETGHMKYKEFASAYERLVKRFGNNGPMLIHMRIRSAGGMGEKNCHPFAIRGGAMIHNGTMFWPERDFSKDTDDHPSDTRVFANTLFNILDKASVTKAEDGILRAVGRNNKLVFLYDGGDYAILNESAGHWDADKGIWFSNDSCKVRSTYPGQ